MNRLTHPPPVPYARTHFNVADKIRFRLHRRGSYKIYFAVCFRSKYDVYWFKQMIKSNPSMAHEKTGRRNKKKTFRKYRNNHVDSKIRTWRIEYIEYARGEFNVKMHIRRIIFTVAIVFIITQNWSASMNARARLFDITVVNHIRGLCKTPSHFVLIAWSVCMHSFISWGWCLSIKICYYVVSEKQNTIHFYFVFNENLTIATTFSKQSVSVCGMMMLHNSPRAMFS